MWYQSWFSNSNEYPGYRLLSLWDISVELLNRVRLVSNIVEFLCVLTFVTVVTSYLLGIVVYPSSFVVLNRLSLCVILKAVMFLLALRLKNPLFRTLAPWNTFFSKLLPKSWRSSASFNMLWILLFDSAPLCVLFVWSIRLDACSYWRAIL